jgi:hypothetical protein
MKVWGVAAVAAVSIVSGSALAGGAGYDGTWSVQLAADGAGLCGSGSSHTLVVENGAVRGEGVSASGRVGSGGSVSLAVQQGPVQGSASGKLSGSSGSGSWTVASLGCSGRWTAHRRTLTAQAN